MAQTPEGKIKAKLDKMLNTFKPNLWFYSPQSGIYGKSGVPDRMGCFYGLTIGIDRFGASAPADQLYDYFGLTADKIVPQIKARLG